MLCYYALTDLSLGYFIGLKQNYKGNNYLKFENNCVPVFFELNGDERKDLIVGSLENGLA